MNDHPKTKPDHQDAPTPLDPGTPTETQHTLNLNGQTLSYTATAGYLPVYADDRHEKVEALVFHTAYTVQTDNNTAPRPLTFVFNGGPGASSVWLHLGALGPYRARMEDDGWMPSAPYELVANPHTLLGETDLVFIDPIGTGYSHALNEETAKKYWDFEKDFEYLSEIIRLYVARHNRWQSPLYIAGESYGTLRTAGIAAQLIDAGLAFNGLILISMTLNFETIRFDFGNDLPFPLFLPTYAATAHYHGRLPEDLQAQPVEQVVAAAEAFAAGRYLTALAAGDRLTNDEIAEVAGELARFTGLSEQYIRETDLRVEIRRFCKELRRDERLTVGRLDSRFTAHALAEHTAKAAPDFDPAHSSIVPPYTAMLSGYLRGALGFETDRPYYVLNRTVLENWTYPPGRYPDTSEHLRNALLRNPHMRVWVGMGHYDLATPPTATTYTLSHLGLPPALRANIETAYYHAGHMMYLHTPSLAKLQADISTFYAATQSPHAPQSTA